MLQTALSTRFGISALRFPLIRLFSSGATKEDIEFDDEEFRVLDLFKSRAPRTRTQRKQLVEVAPPRHTKMPIDQDWTSVWPAAQSFRPSVVPLPMRQGYTEKGASPGKYGNLELMKIPNFLHLTPPHISKHCSVLKAFCTPWPKGLETEELCDKHFPITTISSDYCHSSPDIRDERSRIVTLKISLKVLNLDYHARDKLFRLVGDRYHKEDDSLVIVVDRCPLRKQNYDYAHYLLAALYHESFKIEPWESEKAEADMEKFFYKGSRSEKKLEDVVSKMPNLSEGQKKSINTEYGQVLEELINDGENSSSLDNYKRVVCSMMGLKSSPLKAASGHVLE